MKLKREFQIGVLFLMGLFLLIIFSLVISKIRVFSQDYHLRVIFASGGGLKKGDPVQVSGFEMGNVESIRLRSNTEVRVKLKLYQEIQLYEDYCISIKEASLLGGNYVDIRLGTPGKALIPKKTTLKGHVVLPGLEQLGQIVKENEQDIRDSLANINKFFDESQQLIQDARKIVDKINKGEGNIGQFINDDELYINLKESSESLKKITKQIEEGEGVLGKLVFDENLAEQVAQASDAAVKILEPVVKTKVYVGLESKYYFESQLFAYKAFMTVHPRPSKYLWVGVSGLSFNKNGEVDFENKITRDDNQTFWKLDLQLAYRYDLGEENFFTFRTGFLEGKLGAALDFEFPATATATVPLMITFEARDAYNSVSEEHIDENVTAALFRLYATVKLGKHFRLYAGYNRLFNSDPEFMAGISFRYLDEDIKNLITLIGLSQ